MTYLITKNGEVYIPEIYGCEIWGTNSQEAIEKKKKYWYIISWVAGNEWADDNIDSIKLNVKLETTNLTEALICLKHLKLSKEELIKRIDKLKEQINSYIDFEKFYLTREELL